MNPSFVLDCSVTMAWYFEDEASEYTDCILKSLQHTKAVVPTLWELEVTNVLLMAERKKRIQEADIFFFVELLNQLPIETNSDAASMNDLILLSRLHQLTSYDASYLYLALTQGLPLATLDEKLKNVAARTGIVLYQP